MRLPTLFKKKKKTRNRVDFVGGPGAGVVVEEEYWERQVELEGISG